MIPHKIVFDRDVEKDLKKIPRSTQEIILKKTAALQYNPHPPQSLKLEGAEGTYRLRVGDYRVIYQIDNLSRTIIIYHVRHRKDIYRGL